MTLFPEFHNNYQEFLDIAQEEYDLVISYCDEIVDNEGTITKKPEFVCWGFNWKNGSISYCGLKTLEDEQKAKIATALFIYLWTNKGIEAGLAEKLSYGYVQTYQV